MNVFSFTGNLGGDAEQRFTQGGESIVSFNAAVKSGFGDKAKTTWVRCSMFGKRGESVLPYLKKGQLVGVNGELSTSEWTNKSGDKQFGVDVRVNDLTLLGGKSDSQKADAPRQSQQQKPTFNDLGEDCPF